MKPSDRFWEILGERAKMPRAKGYDEDGEMWMTLLTLLDESQEPKALEENGHVFMWNSGAKKFECGECGSIAVFPFDSFPKCDAKPHDEPKETKCCGKCVRISREDDGSVDEKWCNDKDCQCHQESETGNTTVNTAILGSDCVCLKWNPEANFTHTGPCLCGQPVFVGRCALEGIHYCNERGGKTSHTKPQDEPKEESAIGDLILDFQFNNGLQVGNSIIHMIGHSKDGKPMVKLQSGDTQFLKSLEK